VFKLECLKIKNKANQSRYVLSCIKGEPDGL
jgi:hypothetical protein